MTCQEHLSMDIAQENGVLLLQIYRLFQKSFCVFQGCSTDHSQPARGKKPKWWTRLNGSS